MTIIISFSDSTSIRGYLSRWFVEIKPNIFISSITSDHAKKIVLHIGKKYKQFNYLIVFQKTCSQDFGVIDMTNQQNYNLETRMIPEGYFLTKKLKIEKDLESLYDVEIHS